MISHELKTIFVHIPRTAGTSVEIALAGNNWWKIDPKTKHIEWREAKELYAPYWDNYLKFSIIRNPWDWVASLYFSHDRGGDRSWEEYLQNPVLFSHEQSTVSQSSIIGAEMDLILRYETLHEDFVRLCGDLGVKRTLPHVQIGEGGYRHYSEVYSDAQAEIVAERFKEDIRRFRYKFTPKPVAEIQQSKATISALKERIATLEHDLELERQGLLKRGLRRLRQLKR